MRQKHPFHDDRLSFISTHAPLARCDAIGNSFAKGALVISTHAPLARCDGTAENCAKHMHNFYSRTSCEVRLSYPVLTLPLTSTFLLTHLLRGATHQARQAWRLLTHFYSRTSCEVRHQLLIIRLRTLLFLLTHLLRGATFAVMDILAWPKISTHAPLARCDIRNTAGTDNTQNFYSRTSCEVRLKFLDVVFNIAHFYSRTSCEVRHL